MILLLITTLLSSTLWSLSSSVPRQFHVVKELKNWTEAQQYCREEFTDLTTIENMTEMEEVKRLIQKAGVNAWIGLKGRKLRETEYAWEWSDGSSSSFHQWSSGEPSYDWGMRNLCVEMLKSNGHWNDAECFHKRHFICYEDKLVLIRENKTWNEALQYCRDHNMDLVSVRSERVQRWVTERAKGASTAHVWLGLRYNCSVGWFWVYGETVYYRNWAPDEDQVQNCAERVGAVKSGGDGGQEEGQWVSRPETDKLNFICTIKDAPKEVKKRQIVRVEFQVDPQVNISDPALQQALLQQIQQRLREKGMSADTKLTWMKHPDGQIFHEKEDKKEEGRKRKKRGDL